MFKTIALYSNFSPPSPKDLSQQLQGNCFGYSAYQLIVSRYREHPLAQRFKDPVSASVELQNSYLSRWPKPPYIQLDGISERRTTQDVGVENNSSGWRFSTLLAVKDPYYLFYCCTKGASEGHMVFVDQIDDNRSQIHCTAMSNLSEIVDQRDLNRRLMALALEFFVFQNPHATKGTISTQFITYS